MLQGTTPVNREIQPPVQALLEAAARFGTPVYVIGVAEVAAAAARLEAAFDRPWLRLYSLKANDLPAIASFLHDRGWGASVVSAGEWRHAQTAGVPNESVAFEGLGKTDVQLELAVAEAAAGRPLRWLAIESGEEASVLGRLATAAGLGRGGRPPLDILLRLNPEVAPETVPGFAVGAPASKFGMTSEEILAIAAGGMLAGPGLRLRGLHVHVGSDLTGVWAFCDAGVRAARLLAALRTVRESDRSWMDTIDFGGGFPLPADGTPGPVCESTDSFGRHVLPPLDRGDLVALEQAGAYSASFTSRYDGRPAPAEVLLQLDGTLQPCERPLVPPVALTSARAPDSAARSGR